MQDDRESRPAVSAHGLSRRFHVEWAVRDVTFVLPPRSVLLLVGPNASGKTTLLRLLATALRPTDGCGSILAATWFVTLMRYAGWRRSWGPPPARTTS